MYWETLLSSERYDILTRTDYSYRFQKKKPIKCKNKTNAVFFFFVYYNFSRIFADEFSATLTRNETFPVAKRIEKNNLYPEHNEYNWYSVIEACRYGWWFLSFSKIVIVHKQVSIKIHHVRNGEINFCQRETFWPNSGEKKNNYKSYRQRPDLVYIENYQ